MGVKMWLIFLVLLVFNFDLLGNKPTVKAERLPDQKGNAKLVQFLSVVRPSSIQLSPAEIKLFGGHTLNLLRSKCHNVDSSRIHELQQYISLRTSANIHQATHKRLAFNSLLESIRSCSAASEYRKILKSRNIFLNSVFKTLEGFGIPPLYSIEISTAVETVSQFFMTKLNLIRNILTTMVKDEKEPNIATKTTLSASENYFQASPERPGEDRFAKLLDDLFQLYSKSCRSTGKFLRLFKIASRDLFNYLTPNRLTTEKAADYYLTVDLFQNVTACIEKI